MSQASKLDLRYAVIGTGGLSKPIAGFSDEPFVWVDNTGSVSSADVFAQYRADIWGDYLTGYWGSLLLSSTFSLEDKDTLSVEFSLLSLEEPRFDAGFICLLQDSIAATMLALETTYPRLLSDPGVTLSSQVPQFLGNEVDLGGIHYGPFLSWPGPGVFIEGGSTAWETSTYRPGSGTYQLLVGAFNTLDNSGLPTAFAVRNVKVDRPVAMSEPDGPLAFGVDYLLPLMLLAGVGLFRHQRI